MYYVKLYYVYVKLYTDSSLFCIDPDGVRVNLLHFSVHGKNVVL